MPQVVNPEARADAGPVAGEQEDVAPPVGQPQRAPAMRREHQVVRPLAPGGLADLVGQEPGDRDSSGLVRLGRAQDDAAADVGEGPPDVDSAAAQVDIAKTQGGCLAPAQARVAE